MKESYRKELAAHPDPESCGVVRKDNHEALTGADAGEVLSREIRKPVSPTLLSEAEGHVSTSAKASLSTDRRGRRPSARIETSSAGTGRPQRSPRDDARLERPTKAQSQSVGMNSDGESDGSVVSKKPTNKVGKSQWVSRKQRCRREGIQSRETRPYLALPGRSAGSIKCLSGWSVCARPRSGTRR